MRPSRESLLPWALLLLICSIESTLNVAWAPTNDAVDFFQLYAVGEALQRGVGPGIYSIGGRQRILAEEVLPRLAHSTLYAAANSGSREERGAAYTAGLGRRFRPVMTPFAFAGFRLLVPLGYEPAYRFFSALSIAAFFGSVALLARLGSFHWGGSLLIAGILGAFFSPFGSDLAVGNVNEIQLALLTCSLAALRKGGGAAALITGTALTVSVLLKPILALALIGGAISVLYERRWRSALGFAAGVLGATAFAAWTTWRAFGSVGCWSGWFDVVPHLLESGSASLSDGNFGIPQLLFEWTGLRLAPLILLAAVAAWLISLFRRARVPDPQRGVSLAILGPGIGAIVMLASSTYVWFHYFVFLLPVALYLSGPAAAGVTTVVRAFSVAAVLLLTTAGQGLADHIGGLSARAFVCGLAVATLLGLAVRELWLRPSDGLPEAPPSTI